MILADTSVWIDHFRHADRELQSLLENRRIMTHPFVIGELACGNLVGRASVLGALDALPSGVVATDQEVRGFIERHRFHGRGVGFVDFHLLVSVVLSPDRFPVLRASALFRAASAGYRRSYGRSAP